MENDLRRAFGTVATLEARGYALEIMRSDGDLTLFRAVKAQLPSLLAVASVEQRPESAARLTHEYALASELHGAWAARPLELLQQERQLVLLLEDSGGEPLSRVIDRARGKPLELASFLRLAAALAAAVAQAHARGIIHKDIKPANILVDEGGQVRLTGFGMASRLRSERDVQAISEPSAGTLAYMAPEQTGRMNRSLDARSDLYSLGVTLYEVLTGTLPFTALEPMELVHCHIARQPPPPSERIRGVPAAIDAIVLKLLAKNPGERYSSAGRLEADLRACLSAWLEEGRIDPSVIAEQDVSDRLVPPDKLYGREEEIGVLRSALERVVRSGKTELVLLSGYAGVGKSSLVSELHKQRAFDRGVFTAGKFDQYKRDIPYATLAEAFQSLIRQLLATSDEELSRCRAELSLALGSYGQLMVNLIPELSLVIGEQPPLPAVDPQSAQGRFQLVFRSLLAVFAKPGRPLVLFIDDLQWLDAGTLRLLEHLVTDPEVRNLLLIGAYRDNEVARDHVLTSTIAGLRSNPSAAVSAIVLEPLQVSHLGRLCADALGSDAIRTRELAELLSEKTGGNPFFVLEFMATLAHEGLLEFDSAANRWRWDIARIRAKGITDNVAELLSAKLGRLPPATREALGQLACLGHTAHARTLALLRGAAEQQLHATLADAVEAGFIVASDGCFAFTHDRVQEAAYARLPSAERAALHLQIARGLRSLITPDELDEKVFELVHHYDRGAAAIDSREERGSVAELYLIAGKRAKTAGAYASSRLYFQAGAALLDDAAWQRQDRLAFELELHRSECEIVIGGMGDAEARLATLMQRASSISEQAAVVCLAVLLYFSTGRSERAVDVALGFLERVGVNWSRRPREAEVRREYEEMRRKLAGRELAALVSLPAMSDPACIATMAVLTELFPAAYAVDRYLLELVLLRMTNLSLEHGNAESSSVAYSALNMALGGHFADYSTAFGLGQVACELVEQRGADRYKARVYSCFAAFAMPWIKHLPLCRPLMLQAFEIGSSMGDMAFAAYNSRNLITHSLVSGMPLEQVQAEAERVWDFASKIQLGLPIEWFIRQLELIRKLRGVAVSDEVADDSWAEHDEGLPPQLAMMVCYHWVFRLEERFFAGDLRAALAAAGRIAGIRWAMRSSIEEAEYDFYAALTCAAACDGATQDERDGYLSTLSKHYARISLWEKNCPENFGNRKALVGAELARLEGRDLEAQPLYEQAIHLARSYGFLQNEAVASELAGRFYAARGLRTARDAYLRNARSCYERWGALRQVKRLDATYPELRERMPRASRRQWRNWTSRRSTKHPRRSRARWCCRICWRSSCGWPSNTRERSAGCSSCSTTASRTSTPKRSWATVRCRSRFAARR